jgi:uncharacterized protein YehS (DUF1456 family)
MMQSILAQLKTTQGQEFMMQSILAQLKTTQSQEFMMCSNIAITNHYGNAILNRTGCDTHAQKLVVIRAWQEKLILNFYCL